MLRQNNARGNFSKKFFYPCTYVGRYYISKCHIFHRSQSQKDGKWYSDNCDESKSFTCRFKSSKLREVPVIPL